MTWRRAVILVVALNSTCFLKSCENSGMSVSTGFFFPYAVLAVAEVKLSDQPDPPEILWPGRVFEYSSVALLANLALTALLIHHFRRSWKLLYSHLSSRSFLVSFWLVEVLMFSFIPAMVVWMHVVFVPTAYLRMGVRWVLFLGEPPKGPMDDTRLAISIAARLYFNALLAFIPGLGYLGGLCRRGWRRIRGATAAA